MLRIQSSQDLERLSTIHWLPTSIKANVEKHFNSLREALNTKAQPDEMFSFNPEGVIVVLEPIERLSVVFADAPSGVEYAEPFTQEPNKSYRIGVMLDNEYMTQYIVVESFLSNEEKSWLESWCEQ